MFFMSRPSKRHSFVHKSHQARHPEASHVAMAKKEVLSKSNPCFGKRKHEDPNKKCSPLGFRYTVRAKTHSSASPIRRCCTWALDCEDGLKRVRMKLQKLGAWREDRPEGLAVEDMKHLGQTRVHYSHLRIQNNFMILQQTVIREEWSHFFELCSPQTGWIILETIRKSHQKLSVWCVTTLLCPIVLNPWQAELFGIYGAPMNAAATEKERRSSTKNKKNIEDNKTTAFQNIEKQKKQKTQQKQKKTKKKNMFWKKPKKTRNKTSFDLPKQSSLRHPGPYSRAFALGHQLRHLRWNRFSWKEVWKKKKHFTSFKWFWPEKPKKKWRLQRFLV